MAKEIRMKHTGIQRVVDALKEEGFKVSRIHAANCIKGFVDLENSKKAKRVREKALEMGGVLVND